MGILTLTLIFVFGKKTLAASRSSFPRTVSELANILRSTTLKAVVATEPTKMPDSAQMAISVLTIASEPLAPPIVVSSEPSGDTPGILRIEFPTPCLRISTYTLNPENLEKFKKDFDIKSAKNDLLATRPIKPLSATIAISSLDPSTSPSELSLSLSLPAPFPKLPLVLSLKENSKLSYRLDEQNLEKIFTAKIDSSLNLKPWPADKLAAREATPEAQYLDLMAECVTYPLRDERTQVGTYGTFGVKMEFPLDNGTLPLLTTKKIFHETALKELLLFLAAKTNSKEYEAMGVKIWKDDAKRFYEAKGKELGFEEGDLGPIYGHQWRHFGKEYGNKEEGAVQGVDQIAEVLNLIKTNPNSRRILFSAWNPVDLPKMALPPCHVLAQFRVEDDQLDCILYQRSGDLALGVPFNIAGYSILTHLIAHHTGLKARKFIHVIGDVHVYSNHLDGVREQMKNPMMPFPTLEISGESEKLEDYGEEMFKVRGYQSAGVINYPLNTG